MADNLVQMQHVSKTAASFTHGDTSVDSDENGVITIPSHLTGSAKIHGFSTDIAEKPAPKPLLKDAGGAKGDKKKPGDAEDAGGAKGGDSK
jgi:hypothetical protein